MKRPGVQLVITSSPLLLPRSFSFQIIERMEVLAGIALPHALHIGYNALCYAYIQYNMVEEQKAQCLVLMDRCRDLLIKIAEKSSHGHLTDAMKENARSLESACMAVKAAVVKLAGKSFAWRILHQDTISQCISDAQAAVIHACNKFNIGAHLDSQRFLSEIAAARERDQSDLIVHLKGLAENDQKILEALQADGHERRRLQELVIALTKHVRNLGTITPEQEKPAAIFVRTATMALQRLSNQSDVDIPHWSVTSLEVIFDRNDDASCIGCGGFGRIYKGEWHGQLVAVKEMHWEDARLLERQNLKDIHREISIWSRLAHPHVLPFYCACLESAQPFMVTKLCAHGNALEFLRAFPQADRICILYEVAVGMNYLHIQGVIHADLKASNILIADDQKALIADFGLSRFQHQVSSRRSKTIMSSTSRYDGSLRWMAPERLDGDPVDKAADVYSFAVTAWELFTGNVPFSDVPDRALVRKVADKHERPERPLSMESELLWNLVQQCWNAHPAERPTFESLHPRLKLLLGQSNSFLVVPAISPVTPSRPRSAILPDSPANAYHPGLISPVPPSPFLPIETLTIDEKKDASPGNSVSSLHAQLATEGYGPEKITTLSALESLSLSLEGRAAICSISDLFLKFQNILSYGSSDAKEKTAACLANLAWDDQGKKAILAYPGIFTPMVILLLHGSSVAKGNSARCLSRLAVSSEAQKAILSQTDAIPALINLLSQRSSSREKEQAAKCFACLSCSDEGRKALIEEPELVPAVLKLFSHGTPDAKQNAARCLANIATTNGGQTALLAQPGVISKLGDMLSPDASAPETEQAARCLQYLTYSGQGQRALMAHPRVIATFCRLLSHEFVNVQKHTAACCRNLCQSMTGVEFIFTQRGLPYTLKALLFSAPPETKEYAVAAFLRIIQHCLNPENPLDSLPVRHDRQCFLLALEELLFHTSAQYQAAACLRRLCSDHSSSRLSSPGIASVWLTDIGYRPSLLLALANLTSGSSGVEKEAAQCLALVARRADDQIRQSFLSQPELLSSLATGLANSSPETQKYVAQCLKFLTTTDAGEGTIKGEPRIMSALHERSSSPLTLSEVKVEVDSCLRNLNRSSRTPRLRWSGGILGF